jgi:hypothetical protein
VLIMVKNESSRLPAVTCQVTTASVTSSSVNRDQSLRGGRPGQPSASSASWQALDCHA